LTTLQLLRRTGRAIRDTGAAPELLGAFRSALSFLDTEIRTHNQWEEDHLFPMLEKYTGPGGPCAVMRAEHRTLWDTYGTIGPVVARVEAGTAGNQDLEHLAFLADAIVDLLAAHIHKENEILFPMARRMLVEGDLKALAASR
jgi:hemerythrin-like domain-containing protein